MLSFSNVTDVERFIDEHGMEFVSFYLTDIDGRLRNVTIPAKNFSERTLELGIGFDASNFGFAQVEDSDMILRPDLSFAFVDPVEEEWKVLCFFCNITLVGSEDRFTQDMRHLVPKTLEVLKAEGIADGAQVGVELEFHVIDQLFSVRTPREQSYRVESVEMVSPPSGEELYRIAPHRGYFRAEPNDHLFSIRNEMVSVFQQLGLDVKYHHHEVGSSQAEVEFNLLPVELMADGTVLAKMLAHRIAKKRGKIVTFLPKLFPGEPGNGMHVHHLLTKGGENVFHDADGLYQLSDTALYYIGGILKHAGSLLAFTNPTTNSYRRLVPGFEAPVKAVFAEGNRSAAIRIPGYVLDPAQRRFEFRTIDATCNPYMAFSAMMLAGLDGVRQKIDPTKEGFGPYEANLYDLPPEELARIQSFPSSLEAAMNALEADRGYLTRDGVFPDILIDEWTVSKRRDIEEMRSVPHPWEVARYYDI
ncbi:MAG: type I glutamate--ammonia ligase [Gemmatimonadetes bacterium]|nr:type I glutamate--ammonia ligase [Gemmatimonadota bacterium]